jgi:hypothetical protein
MSSEENCAFHPIRFCLRFLVEILFRITRLPRLSPGIHQMTSTNPPELIRTECTSHMVLHPTIRFNSCSPFWIMVWGIRLFPIHFSPSLRPHDCRARGWRSVHSYVEGDAKSMLHFLRIVFLARRNQASPLILLRQRGRRLAAIRQFFGTILVNDCPRLELTDRGWCKDLPRDWIFTFCSGNASVLIQFASWWISSPLIEPILSRERQWEMSLEIVRIPQGSHWSLSSPLIDGLSEP